jgi:hypothetical protein
MRKEFKVLLLSVFTLLLLFISFNRHSKYEAFHYRSEIFADRAGYYVYLPAGIIYGFKAGNFPDNIDTKTGNGFQLDTATNTVITKYTYGVSLLQFPFFLLAHGVSSITKFKADGFSFLYQKSIDVAAIFYLLLGLIALYIFLNKKFSQIISFISVIVIFISTNLFYYSVIDTGMSHVYSFSMFSLYLLVLYNRDEFKGNQLKYGLLLGMLAGIIVMLRPLNLLFIISAFFLYPEVFRPRSLTKHPIFLLAFIFAGSAMLIPQMCYWNYLTGSPIYYSYAGESFSNILNPKLAAVLFAPNSGHILYNPVFLLGLVGVALMIFEQRRYGWVAATLLIVLIYLISSWWIYSFGCGFANRNFVEYYALLAFPIAYLLNKPKSKNMQTGLYILILLFAFYNIKMSISFDGCWYGNNDWDWSMYLHWLLNPPS